MKTFKQFKDIEIVINEDVEYDLPYTVLSEEVHEKIKSILDNDTRPASTKLTDVTRTVRKLIASGEDTGLEDSKPKKGSSRAVFFPTEHKRIILDGKEAYVPTAVKIAFPGQLDKHTGHHMLLGEMQNQLEADGYVQNHHAVIRHLDGNNYETNPHGVLMPVFSNHPEHHYLEMGRAEKHNSPDFRTFTKNKQFPKGIKYSDMQAVLRGEYDDAFSRNDSFRMSKISNHDEVLEHPHTQNMLDAMYSMKLHPADFVGGNIGIWTHPHTGVKHPVVVDYGFDSKIGELYYKARKKKRGW